MLPVFETKFSENLERRPDCFHRINNVNRLVPEIAALIAILGRVGGAAGGRAGWADPNRVQGEPWSLRCPFVPLCAPPRRTARRCAQQSRPLCDRVCACCPSRLQVLPQRRVFVYPKLFSVYPCRWLVVGWASFRARNWARNWARSWPGNCGKTDWSG